MNNRAIVIENKQKIFQLQFQLSTFENCQSQLQLQQNRVIKEILLEIGLIEEMRTTCGKKEVP